MGLKRKPFQGVYNIVRFNWHFYLVSGALLTTLFIAEPLLPSCIQLYAFWIATLATSVLLISLLTSYCVYDVSNLYDLPWLQEISSKKVLNINAGFDETSDVIREKHPSCTVTACDFYNPKKHTEVSISRARKAYPPTSDTIKAATNNLPFSNDSFHVCTAIFSAHEIRESAERIVFFKELHRVLKPDGQIILTEHLRDLPNFLAYNIGFLHFHSKSSWHTTFKKANFKVTSEFKTTPFITTYVLEKNGNTH